MNRPNAELGWFGKVSGSESHAVIVIAFVMIVFGFGTAIGVWIVVYRTGKTEFWSSKAHLPLAAATSALGMSSVEDRRMSEIAWVGQVDLCRLYRNLRGRSTTVSRPSPCCHPAKVQSQTSTEDDKALCK